MSRIGKLIGGALYVHRDYEHVLPAAVLAAARKSADGFPYQVVKWDMKSNNVTFVQSPDFDTAPEPTVGPSLLVRPDGSTKFMRTLADPWVYHHKYQFVGPDYLGFDLGAARRRQKAIDSLPGVDKKRIGKASVNRHVTAQLSGLERNNVAATSVRQVPALFRFPVWEPYTRNADVGGGKYDEGTNLLRTFHVQNLIYDPYSRPDTYEHVGSLLHHHPADTGTLANVLNVIEEADNRHAVLRDLARFVKPGGWVYIGIYEGNNKGIGAKTKTGSWQNNRGAKSYLPEVREVFPDAKLSKGFIVATSPGAQALGAVPFGARSVAEWKQLQRSADKDLHPENRFTGGEYGQPNRVQRGRNSAIYDPETGMPWAEWMRPYASSKNKLSGSLLDWPAYQYLTGEYRSYRPSYLWHGELNLTAIAEHLENAYPELDSDEASELAFAWAEDTHPEGYRPLTRRYLGPASKPERDNHRKLALAKAKVKVAAAAKAKLKR